MKITVRPAKSSEAKELTTLILTSKQSNGYDDAFMARCRAELSVSENDIRTRMILVAEQDGALLGTVCLTNNGAIESFFIHPAHKRKGVGRLLWQEIETKAIAQGHKELGLDADPAAVPFYEAMGFKTTHMVPSGSIPGRSLPHMRKPF